MERAVVSSQSESKLPLSPQPQCHGERGGSGVSAGRDLDPFAEWRRRRLPVPTPRGVGVCFTLHQHVANAVTPLIDPR